MNSNLIRFLHRVKKLFISISDLNEILLFSIIARLEDNC